MVIADEIRRGMEDSSWIRRMFELGIELRQERGAENVFDLSLGNPITEPPPEFFDELRRFTSADHPGAHRYMPNPGYVETRQAVADALSDETGLSYGANEIVMTVGAAAGLNVIIHSLCNRGDEVVILAPYFGEYFFYATNHGATPVVVGCDDEFIPDLAELESSLSPRTRLVIVNSPNNPSGAMYPASFIDDLGRLLEAKSAEFGTDIFLVSDEPYRKILFDEHVYPFPQLAYQRTLTVTSHAKDLALPGERIGYIAVHPEYAAGDGGVELLDAMIFCNRVLGFVNAPAIMQHVVRHLQSVTIDTSDYRSKRDYLYDVLTSAGYEVRKPEGAFYMFPRSPVPDELELVAALQRHGVLVVPGRGFGMPGYFRISYCVEQRELEGAAPGFAAAISELTGR
ncbi:MAG: pyridoxal phosphate-dependent aminotransferase [Chloroflexi bacterium]|nr:pyridoxal phosphate-dependent aminotransferase [Chloroflexota bacterium]MYF81086.1 pyridoxal phosphate-dependent aminotransferase [Chloroflexota bacterium]MYI05171.1 pyridoxal phosphate-dependent aminotransferase [Chloroflexota bacterium]